MPFKKTLIILRHGQAKNAGAGEHDHSRGLTEHGMWEAASMGELLHQRGFIPGYALCSTATRTRETLQQLQNSFHEPIRVSYSHKIYNASEVELLNQISDMPEAINTLLLVGHNPGLYQLALRLAKDGDKQMHNNLQLQFPTCALVVISFDGEWKNIAGLRTKLVLFSTPEK